MKMYDYSSALQKHIYRWSRWNAHRNPGLYKDINASSVYEGSAAYLIFVTAIPVTRVSSVMGASLCLIL